MAEKPTSQPHKLEAVGSIFHSDSSIFFCFLIFMCYTERINFQDPFDVHPAQTGTTKEDMKSRRSKLNRYLADMLRDVK